MPILMEVNKIYNEDCRETMSRMPDNFIDLTVTSPPYDNLRTYNDGIDNSWNKSVWRPIIKELFRVTKEGGVVVWVVGDATINGSETGTSFRQALYAMECGFNLHDTMIYVKKQIAFPSSTRYHQCFEYMFVFSKKKPKSINLILDRKNISADRMGKVNSRLPNGDINKGDKNILRRNYSERLNWWVIYNQERGIENNHPAVFPESLVKDHIRSWSNEGDLVYDPFMGSGTTAKMAHLLKRKWIGSEISEEYVELSYKRLQPYLNQTTLF